MPKAKIVHGVCKLCQEYRRLCESHLLPRGVYVHSRGPGDTMPFIGTAKGGRRSQHQYKQHLLCSLCERRFNENGERYALQLVNQRNEKFRLFDVLKSSHVTRVGPLWLQYSGEHTPAIDRAKLVYFGLSVFWRASVASWQDASGVSEVRIDLGERYNEQIRHFLLGKAELPKYAFLVLYVCSDSDSARRSFAPGDNGKTKAGRIKGFLMRGLEFHFGIGKSVPLYQRSLSLTNSKEEWIHLRDCKEHRMWYLDSPK
jgi:hypothetical protein